MPGRSEKLPLQVVFIWHPEDDGTARPLAEYCFSLLSRDVREPFSRAMNLPVYLFCPVDGKLPQIATFETERTLVVPLISFHVASDDAWRKYYDKMMHTIFSVAEVVPVALDGEALCLSGIFGNANFIRVYDFPEEFWKHWIFIAFSHELYRRILRRNQDGRLTLFLSHRKEERGKEIAEGLKDFLDKKTHMQDFFDATDILPGEDFDKKIKEAIPGSAFIAIRTDGYSASYWCQKEILLAKKYGVPMLELDALERWEDRSFPIMGNIPVMRVKSLEEKDIFDILVRAMLETVRMHYTKYHFKLLAQWYGVRGATFTSRVPELSDSVNRGDGAVIYYGEPEIYPEEKQLLKKSSVHIHTLAEAWVPRIGNRIGISISNPDGNELASLGLTEKHLEILAQDLARKLLLRDARLLYGGDLRQDGFTKYLFEEAMMLQNRMQSNRIFLKNYLAWPIYCKDDEETKRWKAKYSKIARMKHIHPAKGVLDLIPDKKTYMDRTSKETWFVWSCCLTRMRKKLIRESDIRICVGGKCSGYAGVMPGILEEVKLAMKKGRPIFLMGGFGGITKRICELIETRKVPEELTYTWQAENNLGYAELRLFYDERGKKFPNYENVCEKLRFDNLRNGLSFEDNVRLFKTRYIDEAEYLILKGIGNLLK